MPFDIIAKLGKGDVLKNVPGVQTRKSVEDIVLEVIKGRRTIREFQGRPVSDEILMKLLDAARYAPSAGNQQPWEFIIVKDPEKKKALVTACSDQECLMDAPVLIIACVNMRLATSMFKERGEKLYGVQSVAAAIENILIAAESMGLGTAWIGAFSERAIAILTECPEYIRPCAVLAVGYPAEDPPVPPRQEIKEFVHFEKFGETYLTRELYDQKEIY